MNKDKQVSEVVFVGAQNLSQNEKEDSKVFDNEVSKSEIEEDLQSEDGESIDMEIKAIFDKDRISSKQNASLSVQILHR